MNAQLCPVQQRAFENLATALERGSIVCLHGAAGRGKSTVLRTLFSRTGGAFLTAREYIEAGLTRDPLALEEAFFAFVLNKVERGSDYVFLDDLGRLTEVLTGAGAANPRRGYFELALKALCEHAVARGRKIVYEDGPGRSREAGARAFTVEIAPFQAEDYAFLGGRWLGKDKAALVDFQQVFRFAPHLDAHQLNGACQWMFGEPSLSTAGFLDYIRSRTLASNIDLQRVPAVDLRSLEGLDEVVHGLAAQVVLPLENDQAVREFSLHPKRGVLIHGPAATGKTTIARALAHRLKSKFIRLDETLLTGERPLLAELDPVISLAASNAPSVLFIDDADRLFERFPDACPYLLARLDGLESETGAAVSLVLAARDPHRLPAALLASGRIESRLETKLPGAVERGRLFQDQMSRLGDALRNVDPKPVLAASDGFSAAEVRSAVEEAKALVAYDRLRNQTPRPGTTYLLEAVALVKAQRPRGGADNSQS